MRVEDEVRTHPYRSKTGNDKGGSHSLEAVEFGVAGVLLDGAENVEGDGKGAASVFEADEGFGAGSDAVQETLDFSEEWLLLYDFRLGWHDVGHGEAGAGEGFGFGGVIDGEDENVFP